MLLLKYILNSLTILYLYHHFISTHANTISGLTDYKNLLIISLLSWFLSNWYFIQPLEWYLENVIKLDWKSILSPFISSYCFNMKSQCPSIASRAPCDLTLPAFLPLWDRSSSHSCSSSFSKKTGMVLFFQHSVSSSSFSSVDPYNLSCSYMAISGLCQMSLPRGPSSL